jgi:hypothetical protein
MTKSTTDVCYRYHNTSVLESLQDFLNILIRQKAQVRASRLNILGLGLELFPRLMEIDLLTSEYERVSKKISFDSNLTMFNVILTFG